MMEIGTTLNQRYGLIELLGSGGMSLVYRARDLTLRREVAIKVLRETLTTEAQFLQGFLHEAQAAANLSHPNIVHVYDFGLHDQHYYIVMELVEGQDLKSQIKAAGPMPLARALNLAIQMCAGVGYAHRAGLVHCDIKPQNMLVTAEGRLKVTDFGLARALATIRQDEKHEVVWGTPQYFSPEQAAGEAPTPASDVYSLGVVMYEMLVGRLPFLASSHKLLGLAHLHELPPDLASLNPSVPDALARIIHKVLSKEPSARYRTADQLGRILLSYRNQAIQHTGEGRAAQTLSAGSVSATPTPPPFSRQTPVRPQTRPTARHPRSAPRAREKETERLDWMAVTLGFLAFLAVTGLIPLGVWIYFVYR